MQIVSTIMEQGKRAGPWYVILKQGQTNYLISRRILILYMYLKKALRIRVAVLWLVISLTHQRIDMRVTYFAQVLRVIFFS